MITLNFVIVVEDAGELKTVTATELDEFAKGQIDGKGNASLLPGELNDALNAILDLRAIAAGEYDPADNDTPIVVTIGEAS